MKLHLFTSSESIPDGWFAVDSLPNLKDDPDWDFCFKRLQSPSFLYFSELRDTEITFLLELEGRWLMVLHWVIRKKWNSKHKIPFRRSTGELYEPEGELWYWILELCIQVHLTKWGKSYVDATHWYFELIIERKLPNYLLCDPELTIEQQKSMNCIGKEAYLQNELGIVGDLRRSLNPFNPEINLHHYQFFEACLYMKNSSDIFRKNYWNKFLKAYSRWITSVRKNFFYVTVKNDEKYEKHRKYKKLTNEAPDKVLVAKKGRGKHEYIIPPLPPESLEKYLIIIQSAKNPPSMGSSI